jgi:putative membrane protein
MSAEAPPPEPPLIGGSASEELASNRTALAFERTRMAADRTLMAVVRTSFSLISFGFTMHAAFQQLAQHGLASNTGGRRLGLSLLALGVLLLAMGLVSHARFGRELNTRRDRLYDMGLTHTKITYRATPTFITAALLLAIGLVTLTAVSLRMVQA